MKTQEQLDAEVADAVRVSPAVLVVATVVMALVALVTQVFDLSWTALFNKGTP